MSKVRKSTAAPALPGTDYAKLQLPSFGKFREREFPLAAATLFYGANEAGKTTLFDAFYFALCRPKANRAEGRLLRERYGDARAQLVDARGVVCEASLADDEFRNLYAVRAGEIVVQVDPASRWMDRVKSRLFSGDVDPQMVADNLAKLASEDGKLKHNKDARQNEEELTRVRRDLGERTAKKAAILRGESELAGLEDRLRENSAALATLREQLRRDEDAARGEERVRERTQLTRMLTLGRDCERARAAERALELYARDELAACDQLLSAQAGAARDQDATRVRLEAACQELRAAEVALEALSGESSAGRRRAEVADELRERLERDGVERAFRPQTTWRRPLAALAAGVVVLGGVGGAGLYLTAQFAAALLVGGIALFAALALVFFAREVRMVPDPVARQALLARLRDLYRERLGEEPPAAETFDGFSQSLARLSAAREETQRRLAADGARVRELAERVRALESSDSEKKVTMAGDAVRSWFAARGVNDRDAYVRRRGEYLRAREEVARLDRELEAEMKRAAVPATADPARNLAAVLTECERRLRVLDEDGVPDRGRTDAELRALRQRISQQRAELEKHTLLEKDLSEQRAAGSGEIRGAVAELTRGIATLDQQRLRLEQNLARARLDRRAAALAGEIFRGLENDSRQQLEQLLDDVHASVARVLPAVDRIAAGERSDFEIESFTVKDAGGTARVVEHLSSGTRDSLVFAARLALARRASQALERPPLLVLDEPFLTLDEARERDCLVMLREFAQAERWQVVLLTKESRLRAAFHEVFDDGIVHTL